MQMTVLPKFWNIVPNICKKIPQKSTLGARGFFPVVRDEKRAAKPRSWRNEKEKNLFFSRSSRHNHSPLYFRREQQDKNLKVPELLTSLHRLPSLPIPGEIFRFPDEFSFSPKTDLPRVDATRKSGFPTFLLKFQYSRVLLWVDMSS